jgi:hypothetical protein
MSGAIIGNSPVWQAGYPPAHFGVMAAGDVVAAAIPAVDLVYLYPFPVNSPLDVTAIFCNCQVVGAGSAVKMAVWANNPMTGRPTGKPLLGDNVGVNTASGTGIKSVAVLNRPTPVGVLWFGSKATGTLPSMTTLSGNGNTGAASRLAAVAAADALRNAAVQSIGLSTPDAYANDIMDLDLTRATFTNVTVSGIPVIGLGWA